MTVIGTIRYRRDLWNLFPIDLEIVTCELGVAEGYFSADILSWPNVKHHYLIDVWESHPEKSGDIAQVQEWHNKNYEATKKRVEKYEGKYTILRGFTTAMAQYIPDNSLDFVNVDADHSYRGVCNDRDAYWAKLKRGGVMAFHDFENKSYGVKQAVMEHARALSLQVHLLQEDKAEDAGAYIVKP